MNKREFDIIGMAWSDKISFEEIKKKMVMLKKKLLKLWEKDLKKKLYFMGKTSERKNYKA